MATQATAKWAAMKSNDHGYHCALLASPVTSWKTAAETSRPIDPFSSRSRTSCRGRDDGRSKKRGKTDHSLTSRSGTAAVPLATWRPWVTW